MRLFDISNPNNRVSALCHVMLTWFRYMINVYVEKNVFLSTKR